MKCCSAAYVGLLMAMGVLVAGCGSSGGPQQVTWLVNVTGRLADATTHESVAGGTVTVGSQPAVNSDANGWFTVPEVTPGTNLTFQAVQPDYQDVLGVLTLDANAKTWSLLVVGGTEKQGTLVEGSPGHLSSPAEGQAGAMLVDMTAVSGGDGGDDVPPPPPF